MRETFVMAHVLSGGERHTILDNLHRPSSRTVLHRVLSQGITDVVMPHSMGPSPACTSTPSRREEKAILRGWTGEGFECR